MSNEEEKSHLGKCTQDALLGSRFVVVPFSQLEEIWNDKYTKVIEWQVFSPSGLVPDTDIEDVTYVAIRYTPPTPADFALERQLEDNLHYAEKAVEKAQQLHAEVQQLTAKAEQLEAEAKQAVEKAEQALANGEQTEQLTAKAKQAVANGEQAATEVAQALEKAEQAMAEAQQAWEAASNI